MKNIVVLISGSGSNLQAIIDATANDQHCRVVGVLSNRESAYGLERAKKAGIETAVVDHTHFDSRLAFDSALMEQIDAWQADLVVLAGFMRILTDEFVQHFSGRLLNIHPSLLPKYKGTNTHQRALEAGDTEHGCTVHFVSEELDGGAAIIQAATYIEQGDTVDSLIQKVHQLEHKIYPLAVSWFASERITLENNRVFLDGSPLGETGYLYRV
ncbi:MULTISPECIES: phosphoribosylglycinamide formyltransferase [unclassified Marinobacterium]|jgi:phosphoribosylglycinamide formyltransferase-1|uniref:phosphoribosylglycinamide formyltransferase n=1 Tax=unclassified Marinobacterium TaxID=2644139 RepID=UPI00156832BA|nr:MULTISPECIES: phosphoribosylglycinamide formyltransferase [unclassified Marinobacterium]NRP10493.1 Phosphoribosylglycinamide formyltransferase [Marinobacterium sp. xm-g-48]NRP83017.1 Phosphoribosylglycinamide formyltransferase [Marinobacterium sp. xm-d-509]